jgi:hydroquinone 1,2-dioxygenase/2,6-dichloro-p-hydroquinone 1,2-dioxygenase/glyoxalase family protein
MEHAIEGLHHITLCTGTAQGDVDFFVKALGLRMVKKTLLYDGSEPIYHLYFADEEGTPGTVMTTFPMRRTGVKGRVGSGQFTIVTYSVPANSLEFWAEHLAKRGISSSTQMERFGMPYIRFEHPDCGILFELMEEPSDNRKPWKSKVVPEEYAIRGFHNWVGSTREIDDMHFFMNEAWNFTKVGEDNGFIRYQVNGGGPARYIDFVHEPDRRQGTWTLGEGTIHHGAFAVPDMDVQAQLKFDVEGMGFTDFSDRKNRGYFESTYVRTPSGVMFEATHSLGFTHDEPLHMLGQDFKISPQFEDNKPELLERLSDDPIVL